MSQKCFHCSPEQLNDDNGVGCSVCLWIGSQVEDRLSDETTKEMIIHLVEGACVYAPSSIKSLCEDTVEKYGPQIIDHFVERFSAEEICQVLRICPTDSEVLLESSAPVDTDVLCPVCENVIGWVYSQLTSETTEAEIIELLQTACYFAPSDYVELCRVVVAQKTPEIIDLIVNRWSPSVVCQAMKLCPTDLTDNNTGCSICVFIIGALEAKIDDQSTREQIHKALLEICKPVPSFMRSLCQDIIDQYSDKIVDLLLEKYSAHKICEEIGLCKDKVEESNDSKCLVCTFVVGWLESQIDDSWGREEIKQAVLQACDHVTPLLKSFCRDFISHYTDQLIDLLLEKYPADVICQKWDYVWHKKLNKITPLDVKSSKISDETTRKQIFELVEQVCNIVPATMRALCFEYIEQYGNMIIDMLVERYPAEVVCQAIRACPKTPEADNGTGCSICVFIIGALEAKIDDQSTREQIHKALLEICKPVPSFMRSLCQDIIDQYSDKIVDLLLEKYSAHKICEEIGLCKDKVEESNDSKCLVCTFVVGWLESQIDDSWGREEIKQAVLQACDHVTPLLKSFCRDFISHYTDQLIDLLLEKYPADVICQKWDYVWHKKLNKITPLDVKSSKISDETTRKQIFELVEQVCNIVPATMRALCFEYIEQYGNMIIDMLVERYPAEVVCQAIRACPKTPEADNGTGCSICVFIIGALEAKIDDQSTREQIHKALLEICKPVPSFMRSLCQDIIDQYSDKIVDLLLEKYSAHKICEEIGLCKDKVEESNDSKCLVCTFVVGWLESQIDDSWGREEIKQAVLQACDHVTPLLKSFCRDFISHYTDQLIDLLLEKYPADVICQKMGLCMAQESNDSRCTVCTFVVGWVESQIDDGSTRDEIKQVVMKACKNVPKLLKSFCKDFVNHYADELIDLLLEKYSTDVICQKMGLCMAQMKPETDENNTDCAACIWIIGWMEQADVDYSDHEKVIDFLKHGCALVPSNLRKKCLDIVSNIETVAELLEQKLAPYEICQRIGKCVRNSDHCATCKSAVHSIKERIEDIDPAVVKGLCERFVPKYAEACSTLGPKIVHEFLDRVDEESVCRMIHAC
ncbi:hypothetical protein GEMRC1_003840 [Eukaryota sp. GEM-RC1]